MTIPLGKALMLLQRAVAAGESKKLKIVAVVVDIGGHPVAMSRMDGVSFINSDVAQRKAIAASAFAASTSDVHGLLGKDPIAGPIICADQRISMLPGGVPIMEGGDCIGGLGVAGAHYLQDQDIAEQALD